MSLTESLRGVIPSLDDTQFFAKHRGRHARIRMPFGNEAEADYRLLGYHDPARRRMLVWKVPQDGPFPGRLIPVPIITAFDETIEDDDAILLPMLAEIMSDAAKELGIETPKVGEGVMLMRNVYSSHVDRIGHDPETNELHVHWQGGKQSVYSDVSRDKADEVMNSWSVGKAVHKQIKGVHDHRYLK